MDVDTGELRRIATELDEEQAIQDGLEPVPQHLNRAARRKLGKNKTAKVSLTSGGKLSKWAAGKRKKKRKAEKAARRANRHQGGK